MVLLSFPCSVTPDRRISNGNVQTSTFHANITNKNSAHQDKILTKNNDKVARHNAHKYATDEDNLIKKSDDCAERDSLQMGRGFSMCMI